MNSKQKEKVAELRAQGLGYKRIANNIEGVNRDNVRDFIKTEWFKENYPELINIKSYKKINYQDKIYGYSICECCGRRYKKRAGHQKYCSDKCRIKSNYQPAEKIIKICEFCKREYETTKSNQKYCSDDCRYKYNYKPKTIKEKTCRYCGIKFFPERSNNQKFCSDGCLKEHRKKYKENLYRHICEWCGREYASGSKHQKFCSTNCQYEWQNTEEFTEIVRNNLALTEKEFKNRFENKHSNFIYLSGYVNSKSNVKIKCKECGYIQVRHSDCAREDTKHTICSNCGEHFNSAGETQIRRWLDKQGFNYKSEYSFDDCISPKGSRLRFDFVIFSKGKKILIEYNGKQHYEYTKFFHGTKEQYDYRKVCDKIKENYCIKNNIKLIKIPYWKYDNIENILENIIPPGK